MKSQVCSDEVVLTPMQPSVLVLACIAIAMWFFSLRTIMMSAPSASSSSASRSASR